MVKHHFILPLALLATVLGGYQARADGDATHGAALFSRCSACHAATQQDKIGPHLAGVVGRKAGSVSGYHYSSAMTSSAIVWDEGTLDQFLTSPSALVKGTKMSVSISKPSDRADIIAYLKTLPAN